MSPVPAPNPVDPDGGGGSALGVAGWVRVHSGVVTNSTDDSWTNDDKPMTAHQSGLLVLNDAVTSFDGNLVMYGAPDDDGNIWAHLAFHAAVTLSDASAAVPGASVTFKIVKTWLMSWAHTLVDGDYNDYDAYGAGSLIISAFAQTQFVYGSPLDGGGIAPAAAGGWTTAGATETIVDGQLSASWAGGIRFQID